MKFRPREEPVPEINLVAFIDVLLVVLIFLALTTTYARYTELALTLPSAQADIARERPREIVVSVTADGRVAIGQALLPNRTPQALADALVQSTASAEGDPRPVVLVVRADALASHQSVIQVLEAARRAGIASVSFATRAPESTRKP